MTDYVPIRVRPLTLAEARRYIAENHRHNAPPVGHRFSIGAEDDEGTLRGVAVVGHPVARHQDDGRTAEVVRLASDGTPNVPSLLYGACIRAAAAMGYDSIITYTLATEPGTSLRASGWERDGEVEASPNGWSNRQTNAPNKPSLWGEKMVPHEPKVRWRRTLRKQAA